MEVWERGLVSLRLVQMTVVERISFSYALQQKTDCCVMDYSF